MKKWVIFSLLLVAAAVVAQDDSSDEVDPMECTAENCLPPDCRCSSTNIPGGLNARDTPQLVTLIFSEAINVNNMVSFRELLYDRRNQNGCPALATFFVRHEYTSYQGVNELYNRGMEVGLNSISNRIPPSFWADASEEDLAREYQDQRVQMVFFANIPNNSLRGMRLPFLQMSGDRSFEMMANNNFLYDASWPTYTFTNPGLWPYTLHYRSTQECVTPPCPESSIPGPWVIPMISWSDLRNVPCTFVESCFWVPELTDEEGWYRLMVANFERHYMNNRAPFPINIGEGFLSAPEHAAVRRAFVRFLNLLNNLNDVFMVTLDQVIDYVKNPTTINQYRQQPCRFWVPTPCGPVSCGPLAGTHNTNTYWMQICNACPRVYPWVGNPLGM